MSLGVLSVIGGSDDEGVAVALQLIIEGAYLCDDTCSGVDWEVGSILSLNEGVGNRAADIAGVCCCGCIDHIGVAAVFLNGCAGISWCEARSRLVDIGDGASYLLSLGVLSVIGGSDDEGVWAALILVIEGDVLCDDPCRGVDGEVGSISAF